jgi:hypothetical protein
VRLTRKVRSRFGQPNRDGSFEESELNKEQGVCEGRASRERGQGLSGNGQ